MTVFDDEEDVYIIPHNYRDNGKILGLIDKESFYVGLTWVLIWLFIFYYIPIPRIVVKIVLFVTVGLLPAAIVFVGFGYDTVIDVAKYYLNFTKNSRIYHYEK